ncbi:MAG: DMT family transporter [Patescibacteria group bacterium]
MNLALVLALVTFIGWGTGDLFSVVATRKIGATITTFWVFFFSFLLSLLVLPFAPHNIQAITIPLLLLNVFLGILFVSANVLVYEAFRLSSAPLVGIIIQGFPAVVMALSAVVFKDATSLMQWMLAAVVFIGVLLCSVDFQKVFSAKKLMDRGTIIALIAMIFLSIFFTFSRILINAYDWFLPTFIASACFPVIYFFIRKRKEQFILPRDPRIIVALCMGGLLIRSADFALNYGLSIPGASSLVAPISAAAPILFTILSYFIFRDKLTKQQIIGIVITLAGIVALSVFH